jgi:hypothetical protein
MPPIVYETGIDEIDALVGGFEAGVITDLRYPPGHGGSAFCRTVARALGARQGTPGVYLTPDGVAYELGLPPNRVVFGTAASFPHLQEHVSRAVRQAVPFVIVDPINEITTQARIEVGAWAKALSASLTQIRRTLSGSSTALILALRAAPATTLAPGVVPTLQGPMSLAHAANKRLILVRDPETNETTLSLVKPTRDQRRTILKFSGGFYGFTPEVVEPEAPTTTRFDRDDIV